MIPIPTYHYYHSKKNHIPLHNFTFFPSFFSSDRKTGKKGREDSGPAATSHLPQFRWVLVSTRTMDSLEAQGEAYEWSSCESLKWALLPPGQRESLLLDLLSNISVGAWERGCELSPFTQDFRCEITAPSEPVFFLSKHASIYYPIYHTCLL